LHKKTTNVEKARAQDDLLDGAAIPHGGRLDEVNAPQDDGNVSEDTPKDGLGNPNVSGITAPLPPTLVEVHLAAHEAGFHVVTSGTEVGIFTHEYVYLFLLFRRFLYRPFIRGIAVARLQCENPSIRTFEMWTLALQYYTDCFQDDSVKIRLSIDTRSPLNSPARKKMCRNTFTPSCDSPASTPKAVGKSITRDRVQALNSALKLLSPFVPKAPPS